MDLLKKIKKCIIDFCGVFSLTNRSATLAFVQSEGKLTPASSNQYDSLNVFRFVFRHKVTSPKDMLAQHKSLLKPFLTLAVLNPPCRRCDKVWNFRHSGYNILRGWQVGGCPLIENVVMFPITLGCWRLDSLNPANAFATMAEINLRAFFGKPTVHIVSKKN